MEKEKDDDEETFFVCYVCGKPALYVIELAGEDEARRGAGACVEHARGHVHRGLLTPLEERAETP